jgi:hypothetical protein
VCEERDDFPGHLFIGEAQVNDILQEGEEGQRGGEGAGVGELPEESEADLIGEDGQMVVLEDLAGLDDLLAEDGVLLVDVGEDAFELLSEDDVLVHHGSADDSNYKKDICERIKKGKGSIGWGKW